MAEHVIKTTKDYDKFQVFKFNRPINESLVKRIMESITQIGYTPGKPILVDKDYAIIDGQHRFTACHRLGIEIQYQITDIDPHVAIIQLNTTQAHWKMQDYIHAWAEQGVKCYQHLEEFEERRKLGITNCISILFNGNSLDSTDAKKIKEGAKFTINTNAEKIAQFVLDCDFVPYHKSGSFIKAMVKIFKLADAKQIEKIRIGLISVPQQPTMSHYLIAFENLVNRGLQSKNRVSFKAAS